MTTHHLPAPGEHIYDTYARLRGIGPVVPVQLPGAVDAFAVTTHDAVHEVLAADKVYARHASHWPALHDGSIPPDWPFRAVIEGDHMLVQDGPAHRRLRGLVNKAFTVSRVAALEPRITEIVAGLLDAIDGDTVDLVPALTEPLPMQVICELFGIPEADRPRIRAWTQATISGSADATRSREAMVGYLTEFAALRRAEPGDDLTTALIEAQEGETRLTENELADLLYLFVFAGHETTLHLLGNAITALSTHLDQRDLALREDRWEQVVEETLRRYPPVATVLFRYTVGDTTLAGVDLPPGAPLIMALGATATDPAQHGADADAFDITRTPHPHLAFGHGPHFCLGAPLARLEGRIALSALYRRFPRLRLAVDPTELTYSSFLTNGPVSVPVLLG